MLTIFTAIVALTQPMLPHDRAWPNGLPGFCNGATNFAGAQSFVIPENTSITNFLIGGGNEPVTFSVTVPPLHGSEIMVTPSNGSNYYTPNLNFLGNDAFQYQVRVSRCPNVAPSNGIEGIVVTQPLKCETWNPFPAVPTCFDGLFFALSTNFLDTNYNWVLTISDSGGAVANGSWSYIAGGNICTAWTTTGSAGSFACLGVGNYIAFNATTPGWVCDASGATITYTLCTNCPATATNFSVTVPENTPTVITLEGNGVFAITGGPSDGTVSGFNTSTGVLTYTPNTGFIGADAIDYSTTIGLSCTTNAVCNITVSCPDSDADNFLARASISDATTVNAICTLVTSLKSAGLWSSFSVIYPFVGTTSTAQAQNLVSSANSMTWSIGWTFGNNGCKASGASGVYGDTGFSSSSMANNNSSAFCFVASGATAPNYFMTGINPSFQTLLSVDFSATGPTTDFFLYSPGGGGGHISGSAPGGLIGVSRVNGTQLIYTMGSSTTITETSQSYTGGTDVFLANLDPALTTHSSMPALYQFMCIGQGLTTSQISTLSTIVGTFNSNMGR